MAMTSNARVAGAEVNVRTPDQRAVFTVDMPHKINSSCMNLPHHNDRTVFRCFVASQSSGGHISHRSATTIGSSPESVVAARYMCRGCGTLWAVP